MIITIIAFIACKTEIKEEEPIEINKVEIIEKPESIEILAVVDETEKIETAFSKFEKLYKELVAFKNSSEFIQYGFSKGGNYYTWLEEVREFKNNPDSKLLLKKGVLIGELELLGMAYVSSNGKETEVTKTFNEIFKNAIP
jgi:hypothetical protein